MQNLTTIEKCRAARTALQSHLDDCALDSYDLGPDMAHDTLTRRLSAIWHNRIDRDSQMVASEFLVYGDNVLKHEILSGDADLVRMACDPFSQMWPSWKGADTSLHIPASLVGLRLEVEELASRVA